MSCQSLQNNDHQLQLRTSSESVQLDEQLDQKIFRSDASFAVHISRRYLKVLGIWQLGDHFSWGLISNIFMLICYFGLGISVIPTGLFIAVKVKDPMGKIRLIAPWSFCLMAALKYYFLRSHRCDIENCMKHIELDWIRIEYKTRRAIMLEHARYGHLVTMICAGFTYSGGIFFTILPFVVGPSQSSNNSSSRALSLPSHFVFVDETETPAYEIIYVIQVIATFMMHSIAVASYSVAVVIVMHACGQLKIVMEKITQLVDDEDAKVTHASLDDRISSIISHHVRTLRTSYEGMTRTFYIAPVGLINTIMCDTNLGENITPHFKASRIVYKLPNVSDDLTHCGKRDKITIPLPDGIDPYRFVSSAERMLREICLVDLGGCTLNLCFLGYFTLLEWGAESRDPIAIMTFVTLFISFLFNAFSFCYIGELLTGECAKVGEITYMIDWYRLPSKKSIGLCLVIAMAHSPVTLTAGGAIKLSFACFASIIKTSMGYLNMLRAVMV